MNNYINPILPVFQENLNKFVRLSPVLRLLRVEHLEKKQ